MSEVRWFSRREALLGVSAGLALSSVPRLARAAVDPKERQYPVITKLLAAELKGIEPSIRKHARLYPCLATLTDGRQLDGVYMIAAADFLKIEDPEARTVLPLGRVAHIEESPTRLPAKLANKIYRSGESAMGYYLFTLVFSDGSHLPCRTGDSVDFVDLPHSFTDRKIVSVLPHVGQKVVPSGKPQGHSAAAVWCPFRAA
ncbi:MAG TPA: hypothetical protein VEH07_02700 [Alphaproteobacteria bacterium]|nr:hypothetical protein [Alphaproteobacteria bacterium]